MNRLERTALRIRQRILTMGKNTGGASLHFGAALSIADILAVLYGSVLRRKPEAPLWPERDRFILSKGHGVVALYAALAEAGLLTDEQLDSYCKPNGGLFGHPVMDRTHGIEFSTGSLGMGLSLGIGLALASRRRKWRNRVFVLLGDGECNEGSIWEAAMSAPHFQLDNLTAIVDCNGFQQTGTTGEILKTSRLADKWASFGWDVVEVNGHDVGTLELELKQERQSGKPLLILAETVKGKGVAFMEGNNDWHHSPLSQSQFEKAWSDLKDVP